MAFKKKTDIGQTEGFKFEKLKQSLEGHYIGTFGIIIDNRDVKKHVFSTSKGLISVLGQTHLTQLLEGIEVGVLTRVTYVGTKKTKPGRQPMKLFELEYDEEDRIEVGAVVDRSQEPSEPAGEEQYTDDAAGAEEQYAESEEEAPVEAAPPVRRPAPPAGASSANRAAPPRTTVSPEQKARAQQLLSGRK